MSISELADRKRAASSEGGAELSERVRRLRQQSLDAVATLSPERAELITDFYREERGTLSAPMRRAGAFTYLMEQKAADNSRDG